MSSPAIINKANYRHVLAAWRETPLAARPFARYYVARYPESALNVNDIQTWLTTSVEYAALGQRRGPRRQQRVFHDLLEANETLFLDTMYFRRRVKGGNFVLVAIDGFSGRVWFRAMRKLDAINAVRAFTSILQEEQQQQQLAADRQPIRNVLTDKGIEFTSKLFQKLLHDHHIQHTTTSHSFPNKSFKAERVIRSLRNSLGRQIRADKSSSLLPKLLARAQDAFNLQTETDAQTVFVHRTGQQLQAAALAPPFSFNIGDTVLLRLSDRSVFAKSNEPAYADTLFTVVGEEQAALTGYRLEDSSTGERLPGSYKANQLRRASHLIFADVQ